MKRYSVCSPKMQEENCYRTVRHIIIILKNFVVLVLFICFKNSISVIHFLILNTFIAYFCICNLFNYEYTRTICVLVLKEGPPTWHQSVQHTLQSGFHLGCDLARTNHTGTDAKERSVQNFGCSLIKSINHRCNHLYEDSQVSSTDLYVPSCANISLS